ncbi:type II toxin-antitoxin system RatA family toxin [Streptomyces sp. NRRL B-1347]|uniref:type II toxin-antitoxin system RatA family toxin n=1 Tax=Streptomyces sp. NRRL B-1347 TaxID=1476877 RepID=UPI0004CADBE6|nr:SRPBCC family protein [Streptomyces sp. NRRL B-1347]
MSFQTVEIETTRSAGDVYAALCRYEEFPRYAPDLISVEVEKDRSHWVLAFRGNRVSWTQADQGLLHQRTREFEQTDGDFVTLAGSWRVEARSSSASLVRFQVSYGTSVAHLAGAIDPMIGRVLVRTVCDIVSGVCPGSRIVKGGELRHDLTPTG